MSYSSRWADQRLLGVWHHDRTGEAVVGQQGVPVRTVVDLAARVNPADLARARPDLTLDEIQAALRYASEVPLVELSEFDGLGLVVQWPTGVRYSNQTAGGSVHHPELEGTFIPLADPRRRLVNRLHRHFTGPKWHSSCDRGIDEGTATFIDALITDRFWIGPLRVDRERLPLSEEAWVWVKLGDPSDIKLVYGDRLQPTLHGVRNVSAVLTWPNSD